MAQVIKGMKPNMQNMPNMQNGQQGPGMYMGQHQMMPPQHAGPYGGPGMAGPNMGPPHGMQPPPHGMPQQQPPHMQQSPHMVPAAGPPPPMMQQHPQQHPPPPPMMQQQPPPQQQQPPQLQQQHPPPQQQQAHQQLQQQPQPPQQPLQQQPQQQQQQQANLSDGNIIHENAVENGTEIECDLNESTMANTKEKTPMCLINELARYNRVQHQYTLTDEQGPAHKKVFFVKLKLGEEEYASNGPSIKKAQHAAAAIALEKTQYKHPPPKQNKHVNGTDSITPTVRLNALVMKRGEPAVYRHIDMPRPHTMNRPNLDFRGMYNQRYHYPRYPRMFCVSLKVGQREFIGMGNSRQAARHNAAEKALAILSNLPLPNIENRQTPAQPATVEGGSTDEEGGDEYDDAADALKSEISLVFEIALKRNFNVSFEVIKESGPPHMRVFVTRCTVDKYTTTAEGNSKKTSKKRAAEKMLEELQKLTPLAPSVVKPKRPQIAKKKKRNLIKVTEDALPRTDPNYGVGINPISRLIQIQQAKKEKEPIYTLIAERGVPRHREFVMQVQVGEQTCTGAGPNKKLAKRNAAEAMLQQLGYSRPAPQPSKPAIKGAAGDQGQSGDKKVTFIDQDGNPSRQLVPGVLLMPDGARPQSYAQGGYMRGGRGSTYQPLTAGQYSGQTAACIAKELLETGRSPTSEALLKASGKAGMMAVDTSTMRPKQKLHYLADVLGFQVQFTDFPKGNNKTELLSLVSLSTSPQQVSHGEGPTIDDSHDNAALTALHSLAEAWMDPHALAEAEKMAAGDGPHMQANCGDPGQVTIKKEP